jgi:hypothetical protein
MKAFSAASTSEAATCLVNIPAEVASDRSDKVFENNNYLYQLLPGRARRDPGQVHPPGAMPGGRQDAQSARRHVPTWKKPAARMVLAWASRNARQDCPDRLGAGPVPASSRIRQSAAGASLCPRPASPP